MTINISVNSLLSIYADCITASHWDYWFDIYLLSLIILILIYTMSCDSDSYIMVTSYSKPQVGEWSPISGLNLTAKRDMLTSSSMFTNTTLIVTSLLVSITQHVHNRQLFFARSQIMLYNDNDFYFPIEQHIKTIYVTVIQ